MVHLKYNKSLLLAAVFVTATGVFALSGILNRSYSANLTSVSDTLSTSRLSWVGRLGNGNTNGSSIVTLDTTQGNWESTSSANLFVNDTIAIGNGTAIVTNDTVKSVLPGTSQIEISPVLTGAQTTAGMFMIATRSATHTIAFTTVSAIPNGSIRILIPTISNATNAKDGIPDAGGFDFGASAPTVTCPTNTAGYGFASGTATASAVVVGATTYHAFECKYAGPGTIGQTFTGAGNTIVINSLINPAPKANHVEGTADSYLFLIQNLDSTHTVVADQTVGSMAVVESVRVTATVDPQITFRIGGAASGTSACGTTSNVTTTSAIVPFGSLSISSFTTAMQYLSVSTNATGGYAVTAIENDQLALAGITCATGPCIPDSLGDGGTMTSSITAAWSTTAAKGFAYTLADPNGSTTPAFTFASGFRQFPNTRLAGTAATLYSGTGVVDNANVYVCYKAVVAASQAAGDYTNNITYRATATF